MEIETRLLTVILSKRVRYKRSRLYAYCYKNTIECWSNDVYDYNSMLLGRGVGVDCYGGRELGRLCERVLEWRRGGSCDLG